MVRTVPAGNKPYSSFSPFVEVTSTQLACLSERRSVCAPEPLTDAGGGCVASLSLWANAWNGAIDATSGESMPRPQSVQQRGATAADAESAGGAGVACWAFALPDSAVRD
jgi:hypothetical protein